MAKLIYGSLALEIRYANFRHGWIRHEITFTWQDEAIINKSLLKRVKYQEDLYPKDCFLTCEFQKDSLIETLEKVLELNEQDYWQPDEPDVIFAIYPEKNFPFMKSHYEIIWMSEESKQEYKERAREKKEKGKLPDDNFTIIVFLSAYNFQNARSYSKNGISLHLNVERINVESFCVDLKKEYAEFKEKFKVDDFQP